MRKAEGELATLKKQLEEESAARKRAESEAASAKAESAKAGGASFTNKTVSSSHELVCMMAS